MRDSAASTPVSGLQRIFPGLILLLLVFPPETEPRAWIAVGVLIAIVVAWGWRSGGAGRTGWLLAASAGCISLIFIHPWAPGLAPVAVMLCAFSLGSAARDLARLPGLLHSTLWALVVAVAVISLQAIYQAGFGLEQLAEDLRGAVDLADRSRLLIRAEEGRAFAGFMTPAALGGFYALALPALAGFAVALRGARRWVVVTVVGLALAGLAASASATGVAALAGAAVIGFGLRWASARRLPSKFRWSSWAIALGLLGAMVAGIGFVRGDTLLDPDAQRGPVKLRLANLRAAAEVVEAHPWVGVGPGGFVDAYSKLRRPGDNETRHVHNLPMEAMAEWGVAGGLALSVLFFGLLGVPAYRSGRTDVDPAVAGIAIGVAGFALHNLADFTSTMASLLWSSAILAGLAWGLLARKDSHGWNAAVAPRWICAGWTALLCGALALGGLAAERRHRARYPEPGTPIGERLELAQGAARIAPWDVAALSLAAQLAMSDPAASAEVGSRLADRAVRRAPEKAEAYAVRAQARLRAGDLPGAYSDLRTAVRLHPLEAGYRQALQTLGRRLGIPAEESDR